MARACRYRAEAIGLRFEYVLGTAVPTTAGATLAHVSNQIPSESDIGLAARSTIWRYDGDAAMEAAQRAEGALKDGDPEGSAIWQRVLAAIEKLQANKPAPEQKAR
jgi:hypothetical protein